MSELTRYWIVVAAKDHVKRALKEGIAQSCHGKASPLKQMHKDDLIIFYSGKQTVVGSQVCQQFTGIGRVMDEEIVQVQVSPDFCPARRTIAVLPSEDVSIKPLLAELNCIPDKKNWGYPFRHGLLEIDQHDFALISSQMLSKGDGATN
ncbi:EVE domain-containing protein [Spirosoma knui]